MVKKTGLALGEVQALANRILKAWKASREFRMKDATVVDFEAAHGGFERVLKDIAAKNRELDELRQARERAVAKLWALCTRARSGLRGYFGPNSSQYQQVSGTSAAKRKKTVHPAKPATTTGVESTGTKP
jgi:hypothetical protein